MTARSSLIPPAVMAMLLSATVARAQRLPVLSVDSVIALNVASRGGLARLMNVHTQEMRGHISFAAGPPHQFSVDMARPGRIRTEITLDGGRLIQAYDGRIAWMVNPAGGAGGDTAAHVLPEGEARNIAAGGDMDGPLVDYARKGNRVTLAGIDTADGRPAYRLEVVTAAGLRDTYYIDTVSHLQTKWQGHRVMSGEPVVFVSYFRDYRPVDGVMIAFRIDSGTEGRPGGQTITIDTVRLNAPVSDDEFLMPGRGSVVEDSLYSPALGVSKKFLVYLPRSYARDSSLRYPVAYYLHGTGGNERSWVAGLAIDSVLDSLVTAGMPEMIIVMPDGDNGFYHTWRTSPDYQTCLRRRAALLGGELPTDYCVRHMRYDDYIAHDLVARVDSVYRTIADGRHRAVAGLSMGGYGAVYLPLKYPGVFAAGASLSGAGLALMRVGGYPDPSPVREAKSIDDLHAAWASTWPDMVQEIGDNIESWRNVDPVWMVRRAVAEHG
ncbi:MAG TPA: alpha/beta hydrolase-fold protein, partial [Gemmatimonadaceae bacterium]|nr:alpha/beta hydrolase-fold protein [Gemmatimonadaceae bacterium]